MGRWTFGKKLSLGFAIMVVFIVLIGVIATTSLKTVIEDKDRVITVHAELATLSNVYLAANESLTSRIRAFVLSRDEVVLKRIQASKEERDRALGKIEKLANSPSELDLLRKLKEKEHELGGVQNQLLELAKSGVVNDEIIKIFREQIFPRAEALRDAIDDFEKYEQSTLESMRLSSNETASNTQAFVLLMMIIGILGATVFAMILSRVLNKQIGSAVQHIQSSSTELQAAANQQTSGTREQVSSMNEISTTIRELLATSRQIAESAQRVADIAEETAHSAKSGRLIVEKAQEAINTIKRQVDVIVTHMLDLGKKSQQIGGILEIITELAEQTNILAINATIEAAGAGESGKRFIVVADEIRKLADRVGGSTKDTRTLIDEIRNAVHTTVMATEGGSKAVEAGSKQFTEVTDAFQQIVDLVGTTTEAAREIELSTKQQSSSVEQVSVAIGNISQTAKESEASSTQTLQTVSELTNLSQSLAQLVQSQG